MTEYTFEGIRVRLKDHPEVYPPGDDTFLLLHAVREARGRVLELGTGNGLIAVFLAMRGSEVLATDLNPHAVRLASKNAALNRVRLEVVRADIFDGIRCRFDAVIFNPPYLPTAPEEVTGDRWLDASVNGGSDGREHLKRFLAGLSAHLTREGRGYVVASSLSGGMPRPPAGLHDKVAASAKLEFEQLRVHELWTEDMDGMEGAH